MKKSSKRTIKGVLVAGAVLGAISFYRASLSLSTSADTSVSAKAAPNEEITVTSSRPLPAMEVAAARPRKHAKPIELQPVFSRYPNEGKSSKLQKKNKKSNSQPARRKPISAKDEFMPEVIDIQDVPTAQVKPQATTPGQSRWIKSLSGRDAQIQMAKSRVVLPDCSITNEYACDGKPSDRSINVAGVVMKTGAAAQHSEEQQLAQATIQGNLAQGSYVEGTPAVYLK